MTFTTKTQDE
jgi:hypothetical protein